MGPKGGGGGGGTITEKEIKEITLCFYDIYDCFIEFYSKSDIKWYTTSLSYEQYQSH